jgi:hypothetical protein
VAYPFVKFPSFREFRKILQDEFACEYKKLDGVLVDPDGSDHEIFYFQRVVGKKTFLAPVDLTDDTILTPSVLRSICARLRVPVEHFGFTLG